LAKLQFEKVFTTEEANALLPRLEILVRALQNHTNALRARIRELAGTDPDIGALPLSTVIDRYPELRPEAARVAEVAAQIGSLGCVLKDIDLGLVDFPFEIDGGVIFLCWQSGEREIIAWHSVDSGFGARQPLPGANKPYLN